MLCEADAHSLKSKVHGQPRCNGSEFSANYVKYLSSNTNGVRFVSNILSRQKSMLFNPGATLSPRCLCGKIQYVGGTPHTGGGQRDVAV